VYLEAGIRVFEVKGKPVEGTWWGVWAILLKGPRMPPTATKVLRNTVVIPRWKGMTDMGVEQALEAPEAISAPEVREIRGPRALDLFSGTGSVTRALENMGIR
jgi:hypothetical protein